MLNLIVFISPVLLLIIVGILIRARGNIETAGRRYFLFLVWVSIGSLALTLLNWIFPRSVFGYGMASFPVIPGLIVLTLLHWREWNSLSQRTRNPILLAAGILLAAVLVQLARVILTGDIYQLEPLFFGAALLTVSVFLFITWKWRKRSPLLLFVINVIYLTIFLAFDLGSMSLFSESMPGWMNTLGALAYLAIPGMTIPIMAMLTASALNNTPASNEAKTVAWRLVLGRLSLVIILFGLLLYVYRWLWLWDGTDDGIRWYFMILVSGIASLSTGMVIAFTTTGLRRWAGLIFAIAVMGPIYLAGMTSFGIWNGNTNYTITEQRAARIQNAIESHHAKTGWYPLSLDELVPGELWRVPLPMVIPGQGWCYQGGSNYFRLGAVYRDHWSSPYFEVRVYASVGDVPQGNWECDEKLAEVMSQSSFYGPPPTPVPLPASEVSVPRVVVEPILQARSFSVGDWSPDGKFLAFGLTEYFMTDGIEHVTIDLRFLDVNSGEICQPTQSQWTVTQSNGLRDHSAWLPDGRFLYVTEAGAMTLFSLCADEVEDLADRYPVKFTHVMSFDEENGRILLKNEDAYWFLDGISLEVRKIEGIPTETYWSWYDWSPGGGRLALSLMSGPQVEDEAFLYIVDWAGAQVEEIIPLEDVSDANLPWVEWLTRDELLLHGSTLTVLDFRLEPPAKTDVLREIFLLDIAYPLDVWGMDAVASKSGEEYFIGVQVNHPRNKDAYVYSSRAGQVEIFQHDVSTLVFLPNGQWMRLLKWDDEPTFRDEYELVWMDQSNELMRLKVEGHVPRANFQMVPRILPDTSQLIFSSSQGISLVSIPDGMTTGFWELANHADYFDVFPSPNGEALIVASDRDGLYYIPLSSKLGRGGGSVLMTTTLLNQLGIIPAILITLTGILILRGENRERNVSRFLLFFLGGGVLFQLALFIIRRFFNEPYNQPYFQATWLLAPSFLGILALVLLYARRGLAGMDRTTRIVTGLFGLAMIILFGFNWNPQFGIEFFILPGVLLLTLGWSLGRRWNWLAIVLGLIGLGMLGLFNYSVSHPPDYSVKPPPFFLTILFIFGYNIWPGLSVVISGVLLTASLHSSDINIPSRQTRLFAAGHAISLPVYLGYVIFWGSVWDHTSDGLYGIFLSQLSGMIAIGTGMVMTLASRGRSRLAGLLFMFVVPLLLHQSFEEGWRVSYHEITEGRAERIAGALDQFKAREGIYPESLQALTPRDLLFVQQPVILAGEKWCYESGGNYYRLAAFYREFFSAPVSLRLYESAGDVPSGPIPCEERLAKMKEKYYSPMEDPNAMRSPTPAPLPTSVVNTQRETVQPIVRAHTVSVGKWSPDGIYLIFGFPETSRNQSAMSLSFLKADTGEICPVSGTQPVTGMEDGVREHFAWLPDGRLLYVPASGDMTIHSPCEPDSVHLTDSYPVIFTHALDYHEGSGRVLLKNQTSFWILDGHSLEAIQIPNVTPNPFDLHWDRFDWSPDGNSIAISRLNGRTAGEGSTLFIVNGTTGAVEHELPIEAAYDQSAPMVIWTSEEELLLHGNDALFLIDFHTVPPKFINVLRDIFLLDISYPNDVSTFAWEGHHISIRVNHPRNQGIYIFHPETGRVEIIQPKSASPLFFFPNGELVEMRKLETEPVEDKYELIWVDEPDTASPIITIQGHLPRNYPILYTRYLPNSEQLVFGSSQGVSLISIPDGETLGFWELAGGGGYSPYVLPPSAYEALVIHADGDGLYYIPLP